MPGFIALIGIAAVGAIGVALNFVGGSKSEERVKKWARDNHYDLVSISPRPLGGSNPWGLWGTGRGTRFFEVTVIDSAGATRTGWIRVRANALGIGAGRLDVRWE